MEVIKNDCPADVDKSGHVDGTDLATIASEFGTTCP
jgi:hypothetical protein